MEAAMQSTNPPKRQGRRKIEIKEISDKNKLQVAFSKRRKGLFKKAAELSALTGAEIAVLTFSRGGRSFSFGSPSEQTVIDSYLSGSAFPSSSSPGPSNLPAAGETSEWWDLPEEGMTLEELEEFVRAMAELKDTLEKRIDQVSNPTVAPWGLVEDHNPPPDHITGFNVGNSDPANLRFVDPSSPHGSFAAFGNVSRM